MAKVLVTGADGFIGSHLVELLHREGHEVRALSYYNSFNYWGHLENTDCLKDIEVVSVDIRDPHFCLDLTKDVETVFHLAALIAIPYSYKAPTSYIDTNVTGTANICQAALRSGCKRVVHTSTSEVYGTAQYVPIDEKHPLQPQSPYSASKIGADAMAMSFFNAYDLPVVTARPFNTYGPRQSMRAVIPTMIAQISAGQKELMLGDLTPTRDFNFVTDTCQGFLTLSRSSDCIGKVVNIGSGSEISVGETLNTICRLMGVEPQYKEDQQRLRPEKSEVFRLCCDNTLIKKLTGYEPKFSFEEGLKITIDWFSNPENLKKYKTNIYNV